MTNAAINFIAAFAARPSGLPTRLAVGFGLEALEALASFTPDGGKPSLIRFPRSSAPRIRLASRHLRRRTECSATGVRVKRPDALYLMMRAVVPRDGIGLRQP